MTQAINVLKQYRETAGWSYEDAAKAVDALASEIQDVETHESLHRTAYFLPKLLRVLAVPAADLDAFSDEVRFMALAERLEEQDKDEARALLDEYSGIIETDLPTDNRFGHYVVRLNRMVGNYGEAVAIAGAYLKATNYMHESGMFLERAFTYCLDSQPLLAMKDVQRAIVSADDLRYPDGDNNPTVIDQIARAYTSAIIVAATLQDGELIHKYVSKCEAILTGREISRKATYLAANSYALAVYLADVEKDHARAAEVFLRSAELYASHDDTNTQMSAARMLCNAGEAFLKSGDLVNAEQWLIEGIKRREEIGDYPAILNAKATLSHLLRKQGKREDAKALALEIVKSERVPMAAEYEAVLTLMHVDSLEKWGAKLFRLLTDNPRTPANVEKMYTAAKKYAALTDPTA